MQKKQPTNPHSYLRKYPFTLTPQKSASWYICSEHDDNTIYKEISPIVLNNEASENYCCLIPCEDLKLFFFGSGSGFVINFESVSAFGI
jgi:hypothetical protein